MSKPQLFNQSSPTQNFLEALQASILRRLSRKAPAEDPIVYEFTQDRALLHQYYRLREVMYRKIFHTDKFDGEEDIHDKVSHILIARRGKLCIGGCRLTIREGDEGFPLPMESSDFKLRTLFSDLPLTKERHGEISRFAIMEDDNERDVFYSLCKVMYDKVTMSDVHYLFAKSTLPMARNWRLIANSFGVKTTRICNDLKVPENPIHPEVTWYVTLSNLTDYCTPRQDRAPAAFEKSLELMH